jgi:hypothetical protein
MNQSESPDADKGADKVNAVFNIFEICNKIPFFKKLKISTENLKN